MNTVNLRPRTVDLTHIFENYKIKANAQSLELISNGLSYEVKNQSGCIFMVCTPGYTEESSIVEFLMNCMKVGWDYNAIMNYLIQKVSLSKVNKKIIHDFTMYTKDVVNKDIRKKYKTNHNYYYISIYDLKFDCTEKYDIIQIASVIIDKKITGKNNAELIKKYKINSDGAIRRWFDGVNLLKIVYTMIRKTNLHREKDYVRRLFKEYSEKEAIDFISEIESILMKSNYISLDVKNEFCKLLLKLSEDIKLSKEKEREQEKKEQEERKQEQRKQEEQREQDEKELVIEANLKAVLLSIKDIKDKGKKSRFDPSFLIEIEDKILICLLENKSIRKDVAKYLEEDLLWDL